MPNAPVKPKQTRRRNAQNRGNRAYLCEVRNEKNYTQQQLADYIDVDRSLLSMWENGTLFLPFHRAQQIGEHLPVSGGDLYARHNTDVVRMYIENLDTGGTIPRRLGMHMIRKMQTVLMYQDYYHKRERGYVKRVYRELVERTLLQTPAS